MNLQDKQSKWREFIFDEDHSQKSADIFTKLIQQKSPGLEWLAKTVSDHMKLTESSPFRKAIEAIAAAGETYNTDEPDYHSREHYFHVSAGAAKFAQLHNRMNVGKDRLTVEEQALVFIAALGHDIGHEGKGNPEGRPLENEDKSYQIIYPMMEDAGMTPAQMHKVELMLNTTSPNGPHKILKTAVTNYNEKGAADFENIEGADQFPQLKSLAEDRKLLEMAAILSDADLFPSFGAGPKANQIMSIRLSNETGMDLNNPGAQAYAQQNIVGGSFCSKAGRAIGNPNLKRDMENTRRQLKAATPAP